jgi:predicted nucleotidyltransferase
VPDTGGVKRADLRSDAHGPAEVWQNFCTRRRICPAVWEGCTKVKKYAMFIVRRDSMETLVQAELDMLRDIIIQTVPVDQIFLFGSYAYGTPRKDSDLDLFVVLKDDVLMRNIDAAVKIRLAIDSKKSMPVDLIVKKQNEYIQRRNNLTLERKIAREGICIYG